MQFAAQWPRNKRAMIPEVIGYHLASDGNAPMGANWSGRQTPRFAADSQAADYRA
jgi:hypothetical protein